MIKNKFSTNQTEDYLPLLKWAEKKCVKQSTAYHWISKNWLEHTKKGSQIFVKKDLSPLWLSSQKQQG